MLDVINLALPFFGLIALGFVFGKVKNIPESGLAWMHVFLVYLALPVLFYRILAKTPLDQVINPRFVAATTLATGIAFVLAFAAARLFHRARVSEATIAGLAGAYGNIGYMGPGLAVAVLGPSAGVAVALIFCFDTLLLFSLVPMLMAFEGARGARRPALVIGVLRSVLLHPFIVATVAGVAAASLHIELPTAIDTLMAFLQNAAAPCALFALGVTVALRPAERSPAVVPVLVIIKVAVHPALVLAALSVLGPLPAEWVATAVLMAALPPALNVFIFARQYDTWVREASSAILLGTLASIVTLTTVMWLAKSGRLPHAPFG
jgi:malonate transporter